MRIPIEDLPATVGQLLLLYAGVGVGVLIGLYLYATSLA